MRMQRSTFALLIGSALCGATLLTSGTADAAPAVAPTSQEKERLLKDRDLGPLAKKLGAWFADAEAGEDTLESEQDFRDALTKVNEKRLRGGDLLSSPSDLGMTVFLANNYSRKAPKRVNGKVTMQSEKFGDFDIEYAIWTPTKYKGKEPVTLILSIPEEGKNPQEHIQQTWIDGGFKETVVIASPKMPGDSKTWTEAEGRRAILLTLRFVTKTWAVDANRVFIGGRGRGGEAALAMAHSSPDRFAGAFAWASDAGEGLEPENLRHTPVLISGGGGRATAFADRAKAAGLEEVIVLDPDAAEAEFIAWIGEKTRANYPSKITVVPQGKYPYRSHWIQFAPVSDTEGVRVDAEVDRETNTITLTSSGIREVSVFFCDDLVDMSKPVTVIANGATSKNTFPRSVNTFLKFLAQGKNDAGRTFVATKQFHLPAVARAESDDSGAPK